MQVNEKRRSETKACTQDGPSESGEERRGLRIVDLGVKGEERAAVKQEEGETEEEKDAFEVALASVAEDNHHPKEHEQSACGESDQANVEE